MIRTSKTLRLAAATAVAAGSLTAVAGLTATPAQAATCKHVKSTVSDVGIFNAPEGGQQVARFLGEQRFAAYAQDHDRYRVHYVAGNGVTYQGWVTASDQYVAPSAGDCGESTVAI